MTTTKKIYLIHILILGIFLSSYSNAFANKNGVATFQNLYSSRVTFNEKGEPIVGVGIMSGKMKVTLRSDAPVNIYVYNPKKRIITYASSTTFNISLQSSIKAEIRYYVGVETLNNTSHAHVLDKIKQWKETGVEVSPKSIGASFSVNGRIVDNTKVLLYMYSSTKLSDAETALSSFNNKSEQKAYLISEASTLPSGKIALISASGEMIAQSSDIVLLESSPHNSITVLNCEYGQGFSGHGFEPRRFSGTLYIAIDIKGKLTLGNLLSIETVLKSTVPSEIFPSSPMEALKAQAVAARGQLLAKLGTRHLSSPYHICSTQHCQVYKGEKTRNRKSDKAVDLTRGEFLIDGSKLVDTTYSSSSGGYTENNENAWHQQPDKNRRGRLDADNETRFANGINSSNLDDFLDNPPASFSYLSGYNINKYRWTKELSVGEVTYFVNKKHHVGRVKDLKILQRGVSGRATSLEVTGEKEIISVNGELTIRRLLGNLSSSLIRIRKEYDGNGYLNRFIIKGAGFGHGVGMCQTGAIGRAKNGQSYKKILSHYYCGAEVEKLY